jgi:hypothetical protein
LLFLVSDSTAQPPIPEALRHQVVVISSQMFETYMGHIAAARRMVAGKDEFLAKHH